MQAVAQPPITIPLYLAQIAIYNDPTLSKPGGINMYIMKASDCFGGSRFIQNNMFQSIDKNSLEATGILHELGHGFGLNHTRHGQGNYDGPLEHGANKCEHVTRDITDLDDLNDPLDTFFNAFDRADYIIDTNAVPDMFPNEAPYNYDTVNCEYIGLNGDCQGTEYEIEQNDLFNIMGNAYDCTQAVFTTGQAIRMRETIENISDVSNIASYDMTPLYEPYEGSYYFVGPHLPEHTPLFQPGFDYKFVSCNGPCADPDDCDTYNFTFNIQQVVAGYGKGFRPYNAITHPNHSAIRIKQLFQAGAEPTPRKCYNNYNRGAISGKVTKFNDGIINANYTITPKDSTAINNEALLNTLQPGLYKIDKVFEDGHNTEVIIQKNQD